MSADIIPVFENQLVTFRWPGLSRPGEKENELWVPWDYMEIGEPPARTVPRILAQWTGREDLPISANMVDLFSKIQSDKTWHLSMVFRVELSEVPSPMGHIEAVELFSADALPEFCGWFPRERLHAYLEQGKAE